MPVQSDIVGNLHISSEVVTDISVINKVLPDNDALVESRGIYTAMQRLSADLIDAINPNPEKSVKLFDFSEIPSVHIEGVPATRNLISAIGPDMSSVYQVSGYDAGSQYFRIPSIVKLNSGRLITIFDVRWQSHDDIGKTQYNDQCIGMVYSDDNGQTWSNPKAVIDWFYPDYNPSAPGTNYQCGASDPGILYDEENDVVMVFALGGFGYANRQSQLTADVLAAERQQLVLSWSNDRGATWSKPITVNNKIFDADGVGRAWSSQFAYIFPTCTSGITLRRQPASENNRMVLPVQVSPYGLISNTWFKAARIGVLKVQPVYNGSRELIDIKLVFAGEGGTNTLFGEFCDGANECSICEGPNGEIAMAARAYRWLDNSTEGTFTTSGISIRVAKAAQLGSAWELIGDLETAVDGGTDRACSTLETAQQTKPGLAWSSKLGMYVIGYVQALSNVGNVRTNLVLRCSSDLKVWNYLTKLEFKQGQGYITFVPQEDASKFVECIYEAWNEGVNSDPSVTGSSKQLRYFSLAVDGNVQCRFSSTSLDQGAIAFSGESIKGFSFNLSKAVTTGPLSPMPLLAKPVNAVRIFWGGFSASQNDIYIVIYDADAADGKAVAYSDVMNLSAKPDNKDFFVEFKLRQTINIDTAHEYFIQFKRTSITPYPENLESIPARGAFSSGGNVVIPTVFCSKHQTDEYMKVYQNTQVRYTNSHPWFVYMDLLSD